MPRSPRKKRRESLKDVARRVSGARGTPEKAPENQPGPTGRLELLTPAREYVASIINFYRTSYRGCLETGGDNEYPTHRGVAKDRRHGLEMDVEIDWEIVKGAQEELARLQAFGGGCRGGRGRPRRRA